MNKKVRARLYQQTHRTSNGELSGDSKLPKVGKTETLKKVVPSVYQTKDARKLWEKRKPKGVHKIVKGIRSGTEEEMLSKAFVNTAGNRIKGALAGTAMTAATMMGPSTMADQPKQPQAQVQSVQEPSEPKPQYTKDQVLDAIKQVESSGGKNTQHAVITDPNNLNYGTHSSSAYGIMPVTAKEIISKNPKLKEKYGSLIPLEGKAFHKAYHEHPELDKILASKYYDRAAKNFGGDPAKIGLSWLQGITGAKRYIKKGKDPKQHWHVNKIMNALKNLKGRSR